MRNLLRNSSIRQSIFFPTVFIVIASLLLISITTFINYQNTTSEIVRDTSKEINKQIILNFENYIDSVIDTANYIQQKTIEFGLKDQNNQLNEVYSQAAEVQSDIESIVLLTMGGTKIISSTTKEISTSNLAGKEWFLDAIRDDSIYHFSSPHLQDILQASNVEVITVTKVIDYYIAGEKTKGVLVVDINTSSIINLTETTNLGEGGHIVILNDDDSLIYTNNDLCDDSDCESIELAKGLFGGENATIDSKAMYVNVNTLTSTRWRMATFINIEIIQQTSTNNLIVLLSLLLTTLIITMIASSYIANRISRPINKLKDHMQLIESGEFYQEIEISGQKEVIILAHSFNSMIAEIRQLMTTVINEQKSKRKTEFQALQNQINPHFLYNTLDSIVYLSEHNMNDKVIEMVVALSKFFRISISRGKNIITLKEELEHARNYLLIQQIRYHEKFDFHFEIDEKLNDCNVVKLSLQPLIENAIYHGISTEYGKGLITIRAYQKQNYLYIEVEDDGYGINPEMIEELYHRIHQEQPGKSVGMRNVYQRLKLYYGENAKFEIISELDENTIIRFIIPIERTA